MHVAYIDGFVLLTVVQDAVLSAGGVLQLVEDLPKRNVQEEEGREERECELLHLRAGEDRCLPAWAAGAGALWLQSRSRRRD